ncbi:hypothetical protein LINGRAHAP2_LOCUS10440 [Linum grandiflorum]
MSSSINIKGGGGGGGGTPSIVARLMGVDTLPPLDTISVLHPTRFPILDTSSTTGLVSSSNSRKDQLDHFYPKTDQDSSDQWCNSQIIIRREHPQEEQLQKFKREFEAWQASRFKQCSTVAQIVANTTGQLERSSTAGNFGKDDGEMQQQDLKNCGPDKIVILKPSPDDCQDSLLASTSTSPAATTSDTTSIDNFLEQVKQRLKTQLEAGKHFQIELLQSDDHHPTNANLVRSESTRSSKREMHYYSSGTEFMNRNTRRFLSERLRNIIVRKRTTLDVRSSYGSSQLDDITKQEMQTRSFRHEEEEEEDYCVGIMCKEPSPRNLMRSLSAPVSFGKLLLEDRHILTGVHIRRKHEETLDTVSEHHLQNGKKERFNIKQKVDSFRHNLSLKGKKMFRKRFQRVESCNYGKDIHIVNNTTSTRQQPTVVNIGERQRPIMENSTEVPPSPASICSNAQEELWRPSDYNVSPVSTPDHVTLEDESGMPQVFRDICSNLKELRRQINRLGSTHDDEESSSVDCGVEHREEENVKLGLGLSGRQIEEKAEAWYIKDLLIASGLFDGSSSSTDMSLLPSSRWDPLGKTIPHWVFEQVEEASGKKWDEGKDNDVMRSDVDRKMMYDLLNEALITVIPAGRQRQTTTSSTLRGTKLLERVWKMVQEYVYPPNYGSGSGSGSGSDVSVVERQMGSITSWWSWGGLNYEDELATEMQFLILEDMIQDTLTELI